MWHGAIALTLVSSEFEAGFGLSPSNIVELELALDMRRSLRVAGVDCRDGRLIFFLDKFSARNTGKYRLLREELKRPWALCYHPDNVTGFVEVDENGDARDYSHALNGMPALELFVSRNQVRRGAVAEVTWFVDNTFTRVSLREFLPWRIGNMFRRIVDNRFQTIVAFRRLYETSK